MSQDAKAESRPASPIPNSGTGGAVTNPKGYNQHKPDPRQALYLAYFLDPKSKTFGNSFQSARRAGFSKHYAQVIKAHNPTWLSTKVKEVSHLKMLQKAERNLDEMLDLKEDVPVFTKAGPLVIKKEDGTEEPVLKKSTEILKVKADVTKFVASKLDKKTYGDEKDSIENKILIINISGESAQRYAVNASPKGDSA